MVVQASPHLCVCVWGGGGGGGVQEEGLTKKKTEGVQDEGLTFDCHIYVMFWGFPCFFLSVIVHSEASKVDAVKRPQV
jgi:hypothetical protein